MDLEQNQTMIVWGVITAVVAQVMTLITLMFNARQARLRREVERREELEDRAALRAVEVEDRKALAAKVINVSEALARKVEESSTQIHEAIADNTRETIEVGKRAEAAYTEANHSNVKISDVKNEISNLNQRLLERRENVRNGKTIQ